MISGGSLPPLAASFAITSNSGNNFSTNRNYITLTGTAPIGVKTVKINGRSVLLVENFGGGRTTCHVPARRPIYVNELSTQCSTLPGHHNGFGTSDSDLRQCSRVGTVKALISAWLDGRDVPHFGHYWWKGTLAFGVDIPQGRFPGNPSHARAAAWGWSLALRGLPKGKHTIKCQGLHPNRQKYFDSRVTLYVH